MRTTVIGEVGECFNGDFDTALKMIDEISKAGCDIVKFQLLDLDEVAYDDPEKDWFQKLELQPEKIEMLMKHAELCKIGILFTPVSVKTASWMHELGCQEVKIASSFLKKKELIDYVNQYFQKVYISTGMAELTEIQQTLDRLDKIQDICILHCISEYPTGPLLEKRGLVAMKEEDAHLNMLSILMERFAGHRIGYSDHTDGIFVPVIAAAMGADVIEKHVTLDRKTPVERYKKGFDYMGTDHVLSIEPEKLKEMVSQIRRIEAVKGNNVWERSAGEKILLEFLRQRYRKENV